MKNEQSIIANETTSQFNLYAERLAEIGFDPIPIPFNKKYPIDKGWPKKIYKPGQQWNLHGVGHRCPTIGVIDADITDIDLAFEFFEWCRDELGIRGIRVGQPPKWAALVMNKYVGKHTSAIYDGHSVELLGAGQQVVLFHRYPGSNRQYEWDGATPLDYLGHMDQLPVLDRDGADRVIEKFHSLCEARGFTRTANKSRSGLVQGGYEAQRKAVWALFGGRRDRVTQMLDGLNLIKEEKEDGKFELICPWGHEHSNGDPGGAAYWSGIGVIQPQFNCLHTTCKSAGRGYEELHRWLQNQTKI